MQAIALKEGEQFTPAPSESAAILQVIERAAANPQVDIDKMERLLAMQERIVERNAKAAYTASMVLMKPKLPVIDRKGRIEVRAKAADGQRTGAIQQSTGYALWEDIDEAITPILSEHGFALTFRSGVAQDGKITVTGVLSHKDGHSEETTITLPHDSTGSKNAVQAVGSSTSYGKRYTATLLLNIRTKGDDDDGHKAGSPEPITDKQIEQLQALIVTTGSDIKKYCAYLKVQNLESIPAGRFEEAKAVLEQKKKKQ